MMDFRDLPSALSFENRKSKFFDIILAKADHDRFNQSTLKARELWIPDRRRELWSDPDMVAQTTELRRGQLRVWTCE